MAILRGSTVFAPSAISPETAFVAAPQLRRRSSGVLSETARNVAPVSSPGSGGPRDLASLAANSTGVHALASLSVGAASVLVGLVAGIATRGPRRRLRASRATSARRRRGKRSSGSTAAAISIQAETDAAISDTEASKTAMSSPFGESNDGVGEGQGREALPLTLENVELVLDEVRPYLISDGGNCKLVGIDGTVVRLELQGACSSCSASSVTLKMGIAKTLMERIPDVTDVVPVAPNHVPLSPEGVEAVLDDIRPFLATSGGSISLSEIMDDEPGSQSSPKIVLSMAGPPLQSMAIKVEVINRVKKSYPFVQDVIISEAGV